MGRVVANSLLNLSGIEVSRAGWQPLKEPVALAYSLGPINSAEYI